MAPTVRNLNPPTIPEPPSRSILDPLIVLADRKWFILALAFGGGVLMAIFATWLTPLYTATASILPPQQQQSTAAALLGQLAPLAGASASLGLKNPAELYVAILSSRTIADDIIHSADLERRYRAKTMSEARQVLARRSNFAAGRDSLIRISVQDPDPKESALLANAYVEGLYKQTGRLSLTESSQRRLFFEKEMQNQKRSLSDAEVALKNTEERTGVLQVSSQVDSMIRSMAQLRAEIASREVALASLRNGATAENPEVVRQESELAAMRSQLKNLEASNKATEPGDPLIPTSQVPKAGLQYVRALRDLQYNETLFELLSKQYEVARIDEAKDAPLIQVVDSAIPPERKSWPPRLVFALVGAMAGGLLACLLAMLQSPLVNPQEARKLNLLKRRLFSWRRGRA